MIPSSCGLRKREETTELHRSQKVCRSQAYTWGMNEYLFTPKTPRIYTSNKNKTASSIYPLHFSEKLKNN